MVFCLSIVKHGTNLSHVSFMSTIPSAKLSGVQLLASVNGL